ncbi:hypothetical protein [Streptomyces luomodiensis]|uniref:hypothetical protein n=1 Tax=Streptomyces luomodiensis TaxID=3026192 RepID=UPI003D782FD3
MACTPCCPALLWIGCPTGSERRRARGLKVLDKLTADSELITVSSVARAADAPSTAC